MISPDEALKIILQSVKASEETEEVSIIEAFGRTLGKEIYAKIDLPLFDNSAMDGYALKAIDTQGASPEVSVILEVIEEVPAGYFPTQKISPGQATKIMTGAPIPEGSDTVLMKEFTEIKGNQIKVFKEAKVGENIRHRGEDVRIGQLVLEKGKLINPSVVGMLATLGKDKVRVVKRPTIAVLATGDELTKIDEILLPGKIHDSNSYALLSLIQKHGGVAKLLGIAKDNLDQIKEKIKEGFNYDFLVISGGVSVGDYDLVHQALEDLGVEIKFSQVAIKPGKPLTFGLLKDKLVFGLPGNVVSVIVCFEKFIRPVILKMLNQKDLKLPMVTAELKTAIEKKGNRRYFFMAKVTWENGKYWALPTRSQSSGSLRSMIMANGLIIVPESVKKIPAQDMVLVEMLEFPSFLPV
ncbi:molybdopterin molybdotransferase MoeA [bacterium]|nr:molybdopterin molybdotransferase MoeA [bacterium]